VSVLDAVKEALGNLQPAVRSYVDKRITWKVQPVPSAAHLEMGAKPTDRGLFVGTPVRSPEDEEGGELYEVDDQGDGIAVAEAQGETEYYASEGDDIAEASSDEPHGTIYLFVENIRPLTKKEVADVVLHELAHFFGETEESAFMMGVGDGDA
jgi:hypothetical protein